MRAMCKVLLVLGLMALLAGPGLAQGQRKGGGFGRGGFGGPGMLLNNKGVQKELKMTDDQTKKVTDAFKEVQDKHRDEFAGLQDLQGDERREKMQEIMKKVNEEQTKVISEVLSADQVKRLNQIELQNSGPRAFTQEKVQKDLKLTDDQKDKIKTIADDLNQEMQGLRGGGGDFQENMKKMASMRKEAVEKITAVLTDDQKKAWKELTGEPYEVKFEAGQFGGRRGKKKDGV
jgi:Spy/CpxP family protein refolding chaperone